MDRTCKVIGPRIISVVSVALVALLLAGCPSAPPGDHVEEELTAKISTTSEELRTLEEATFLVEIEDENGDHMMDMAAVSLEVRSEGGEWREIELMAMDEHYMGTRTFSSSGDYEFRVMGASHMGHDMEEMHSTTMHVVRAPADAGEYHVQYESDPGHIHEGAEAILTFWVSLEDGGAAAVGLAAEIVVEESDGHTTTLDATEIENGVYQATMTFADAGETHVEIVLPAGDGSEVEADFHFHVSEVH